MNSEKLPYWDLMCGIVNLGDFEVFHTYCGALWAEDQTFIQTHSRTLIWLWSFKRCNEYLFRFSLHLRNLLSCHRIMFHKDVYVFCVLLSKLAVENFLKFRTYQGDSKLFEWVFHSNTSLIFDTSAYYFLLTIDYWTLAWPQCTAVVEFSGQESSGSRTLLKNQL